MSMIRFMLAVTLVMFTQNLHAQLQAIRFHGEYSFSLAERHDVTKSFGGGGGAELRFGVYGPFSVSLHGIYHSMYISEPTPLENWNWRFWNERYRGYIQSILLGDSTLRFKYAGHQYIRSTPVLLTLNAEFGITEGITVKPYAGGGLYFFTRRLDIKEMWSKYYATIGYEFQYEYYNFAEPKRGNPVALTAGIDAEVELGSVFVAGAGVRLIELVDVNSKRGFDFLPFRRIASGILTLTFKY